MCVLVCRVCVFGLRACVLCRVCVCVRLARVCAGRIRTLPALDVPIIKNMGYTLHLHNYVGQCDVTKLNKLLDGVAVAIQRQKAKVGLSLIHI